MYNARSSIAADKAAYHNTTAQLGALGLDTSVPDGVRDLAETTVARTRQVYDRSRDAYDASLDTFERTFDAAGLGATAFNRKIVELARRNVDATFDLAQSLAGARNFTDIVELQAAFWRKQFGVLTEQAKEVGHLSAKVMADAAEQGKATTGAQRELR